MPLLEMKFDRKIGSDFFQEFSFVILNVSRNLLINVPFTGTFPASLSL